MSSLKALQALMHEKYGLDESALDPHASLSQLGVDSLALVEFLFEVEERFHIDVEDANMKVDTLAGLALEIDRILASKSVS